MMNNMREFIDIVQSDSKLEEGTLNTISNWFKKLGDPIKKQSGEYLSDLEHLLAARYGSTVAPAIKKNNKSWMFGKLTYQYLYAFARKIGFTDEEIDRAVKNRVVTNTLTRAFAALPQGTEHPQVPLSVNSIKNNSNVISTMMDRKTQTYLSKSIASVILDNLAHIHTEKKLLQAQAEKARAARVPQPQDQNTPYVHSPVASVIGANQNVQDSGVADLKAALDAIKHGLASMRSGTQ